MMSYPSPRCRGRNPLPLACLLLHILAGPGDPCGLDLHAQVPPGTTPKAVAGFELTRWAREPMLRSPVALAFDPKGRLYVAETARRSTVDIDIRAHPDWVVHDLANQSVDDLRRFFRERMSPEHSAQNASWLRDLDGNGSHDWRDLTMVQERVDLLEDTSGHGRATRAGVFFEGFHEEITGVLAGVLPWGDDVFVTVYPDLWRLRDTNGDGVADQQESVFRGFGVHAAFDGHDLHGLTMGPDGKLYFSIGDNGFSVTNREGRRLHHPNTGGVLRMNPDGSSLEVFATGLRNPQEIAFDEWGNLFTVDNDGDLADERERFVFIAEGSDSGWRLHWQFREQGWAKHTRQPNYNPWIDERLWVPAFPGQPAHITPPLTNYSVGPGSFVFNPGTALTDAYRGHFFLIQFPVAKVTTFQARPRGAGFEMAHEQTFVSGMMASSLAFAPDGSLAIGDWDGLWSPSGRGSIWKVDAPGAADATVRREVRDGLARGATGRTTAGLIEWLGHPDRRLRLAAQFELVRRGDSLPFSATAASPTAPVLARIHALWGLGQGHALRLEHLETLRDPDPRIRAQTARVLGDSGLAAGPALLPLLTDPEPTVQFHAALSLGKLGGPTPGALEGLTALLEADADADAFLRHAGVMGLAGCVPPSQIASLAGHASPAVRRAAVVALRRRTHAGASAFLRDADPTVQAEAIRAIHDDEGIPGALEAVASLGNTPGLAQQPGLFRRILNANLRLGTAEAADRLVHHATTQGLDTELRIEAVRCLADWSSEPALDRVQGFVRALGPRDAELGRRRLQENFSALTRQAPRNFLAVLLGIVLDHRIPVRPELFSSWALDEDQPADLRARALELIAGQAPELLPPALARALASQERPLRLVGRRLQAQHQPQAFMVSLVTGWGTWSVEERQEAIRLAAGIPGELAAAWIATRVEDLDRGRLDPELHLDVMEAAGARTEPGLRARALAFDIAPGPEAATPRQQAALRGGDPGRGREVFQSHPNAQCVRCHDAGGEGQQVGPVLRGIAAKVPPAYLLEAVLNPSARIADGFATTSVMTAQGEELDGVRVGESDETLSLRLVDGSVRHLAKRDLRHTGTSTVSTMPPMGTVLTPFELRDLFAYLQTLK